MKAELKLRHSFDEIDERVDQFFIRMIDGKIIKGIFIFIYFFFFLMINSLS